MIIKHSSEPVDEFIISRLESLQLLFLLDAIFEGYEG